MQSAWHVISSQGILGTSEAGHGRKKQLSFLFFFLIFLVTPADLHLVGGLTGTWQMLSGRVRVRKKGFLEYIKIFREEEPDIPHPFFFFLGTTKKSLLEARVIYKPNRPGNPAGLLELATNRNRGIVSRPLAG